MHSLVCCHTTPRLGKGEAKYIALTRVKPSRAGGWFRAAFHFRVSVKSNFGLSEKQVTVTMEASHRSGARLPKSERGTYPDGALGGAGVGKSTGW